MTSAPIDWAAPLPKARPVQSYAPVILTRPNGLPLAVRVSAPASGTELPIIVFSHGNGQSLHGYEPLAGYWAAHGFAVLQPTHLDSRLVNLPSDDPLRPQLWRFREEDLLLTLDSLDQIEEDATFVAGRLDRSRISVAGHSWGGQTASTLLGARHPDPDGGSEIDRKDARVKAGVLLAVPGKGGDDLSEFAAEKFPFMHPDFSDMTPPTLVIAGDHDKGGMTVRGPDWWRDAFDLSPSPKALLTVYGGEHSLGGIPGYEARETTDQRPERVSLVQHMSTAFLKSALYPDDHSWKRVLADLEREELREGVVETK